MTFPIIQFGASRFLQAHVDLFVSQALARLADIHDNHDAKKRRRFGGLIELANAHNLHVSEPRLEAALASELTDRMTNTG